MSSTYLYKISLNNMIKLFPERNTIICKQEMHEYPHKRVQVISEPSIGRHATLRSVQPCTRGDCVKDFMPIRKRIKGHQC